MPGAKPYVIPKQLVWEAYQRVKANQGAAGVDGESLAMFEQDLKGNLYKVWNRMSSGSYFPPPVRLVEIPKEDGGKRPLGIPTAASYCTFRRQVSGWVARLNSPGIAYPLSQLRFD
jgi:retron-type reverse transcriptase